MDNFEILLKNEILSVKSSIATKKENLIKTTMELNVTIKLLEERVDNLNYLLDEYQKQTNKK